MAQSSLPSYPPFDLHGELSTQGLRWKKWIRGFENLMVGMDVDNNKRQRALLMYYAGDDMHDMFETLPDRGDDGDYASAKQALDKYMEPNKNTEKHEHEFRKIKQLPGESIDAFHTRLKQKTQFCDFHDVNKEVRLQIVSGTTSRHVRHKGLKNSSEKLPLAELLADARAYELANAEADIMERAFKEVSVNHIRPSRKYKQPREHDKQGKQKPSAACYFCGGSYPHEKACPAEGKTCNNCKKIGHFEQVCHAKKSADRSGTRPKQGNYNRRKHNHVRHVEQHSSSEGELFAVSGVADQPRVNVTFGDESTPISMVIDSGCPHEILCETVLDSFHHKPTLRTTNIKLYPYMSKEPIPIIGKFKSRIMCDERTAISTVYVVKGTATSLMSRATAEALDILEIKAAGSSVCNVQTNQYIQSLLEEHKDLFNGVGKLKDFQVKLHVSPDIMPVAQPHRRVPYSLRDKIEKKIKELEDEGIIEEVTGPTPWVSPIVCVPKPRNPDEIRMCVDMRAVNEAIQRERHITPTITEIIADVNGSTVFSKLDLNQGYHQLELAPESRHLTTFSTHIGLRRYKRLNFGISCASEIFQNAISQVLQGLPGVLNISDDILIYAGSDAEHTERLQATLKRLQEHNLTLNHAKCEFGKSKMEFFGFIFSKSGLEADDKKVKSILQAARPESASEVRSFLGMITYVSRFIPNMATLAAPLRLLTRKNERWRWDESQDQAYRKLKECLLSTAVMAYFDTGKETSLVVDASPVGLGAMLVQEGHVVSYASRALSDVESRYSQTEREALAILWACDHFRLYIYGRPIQVVTDHKALVPMFNKSNSKPPPRIERWMMKLQDYDITVVFSPGSTNPADYMSRHPISKSCDMVNMVMSEQQLTEQNVNFVISHSMPKAISMDQMVTSTKNDRTLSNVIRALQDGRWYEIIGDDPLAKALYMLRHELCTSAEGILMRGHRIVIPTSIQQQCIDLAHIGHQGIVKTKNLLKSKVWFPGLDKLVEDKINCCVPCQAATPATQSREPLKMTEIPSDKWEKLSMDFCGPLNTGDYIMVVIDDHSRYPEVDVISSTSSRVVIPRLERIFAAHGVPAEIKTDNGPPFNGQEFRDYADTVGFHHRKVTPLWPEANGEAERFMRTLMKAIHAATSERKHVIHELYKFLRAYRATPHQSTGVSPSMALNNREMNIGLPNARPTPTLAETTRNQVVGNDQVAKAKMRAYADARRHSRESNMEVGDTVLVKNTRRLKMDPPYSPEPQVITAKKGDMVTASGGDGDITRNASHFKKIHDSDAVKSSNVHQENNTPESAVVVVPNSPVRPVERPRRERHTPIKLRDYVTK